MKPYHKIQTIFKRDPANNHKTLLLGEYSLPEFEYLAHNAWTFTEKVDGTNIRIMFDGERITFGGKTDRAQLPPPLLERLTTYAGPGALKAFVYAFGGESVCLYGEGYGAKIQKGGGNYSQEQRFVLFDVRVGDWWLQRADVEDVADKLAFESVPVIGEGTLGDLLTLVRTGFDSKWGSFLAEGIVARPSTELCTRGGDRVITKLKHKDFPCALRKP